MTFDDFIHKTQDSFSNGEYILMKYTWDFQQAKIDRLMFEYCTEEMTPEQLKKFEEHQKCVTS